MLLSWGVVFTCRFSSWDGGVQPFSSIFSVIQIGTFIAVRGLWVSVKRSRLREAAGLGKPSKVD